MGPKDYIQELRKIVEWFEDNCGDEIENDPSEIYIHPSREFDKEIEHAKEYLELLEEEIK